MFSLASGPLTADLLDPAAPADRARLGPRFGWGGYIWQVRDTRAGDLLAGPEHPEANPIPFNGQGLPEAIRWAERGTGRMLTFEHRRGFIIGGGDAAIADHSAPEITKPCEWIINRAAERIDFRTRQAFGGWACDLQRSIIWRDRTLTSATRLASTGTRSLPLHWFAHPFFALTDRLITGELPAGYRITDNPGFALTGRRFTMKERYATKDDGHFELLHLAPGNFAATFSHPKLQFVRMATDFAPQEMPVWANSNTFSIEPYLETELAPGASRAWSVSYEFGPLVQPR